MWNSQLRKVCSFLVLELGGLTESDLKRDEKGESKIINIGYKGEREREGEWDGWYRNIESE